MREVDVRGLSCPLPLMHTRQALDEGPSEILVLVDDGTARANVLGLLADAGYDTSVEQTAGEYRITGVRR